MPGAHVHVDDCAAFVEHGNLRCRGAYAEHVFPLRILERLTVDAVTQSGGAAIMRSPAFGLLVIEARDRLLCGFTRRVAVEIRVTAHGVRVEATLGLREEHLRYP